MHTLLKEEKQEQEQGKKKRNRNKKNKTDDAAGPDNSNDLDFEVDMSDPRFSSLWTGTWKERRGVYKEN